MGRLVGATEFTITRKNKEGEGTSWRTGALNPKARIVCEHCNSGWMSKLEATIAKPILENMILHASPVSLLRLGVASIVAFAFKSAVVADAMNTDHVPFYSLSQRRQFARALTIPDGTQVWLCALAKQHGIFKSYFFKTPDGKANGFHLHVFTYGMGHFAFQVVSIKWTARNQRRHQVPPFVRQSSGDDDIAIPLWPWNGIPILWPPRQYLLQQSIDEFAFRWKDISLTR